MIVFDLVKIALRIRAVTLLPELSYIEISRCSDIVFRRVSYFVFEEIIVDVRITVDFLQKAL
jgi:hypothetical protein